MTITVLGVPAPQGSLKAFLPKRGRRPIITSDNKNTRPWKSRVTWEARLALRGAAPLEGPVGVTVRFWMPAPKKLPKRVLGHTTKPDLDKLVRAILDALTDAGVWRDDAQVVRVIASKTYGFPPQAFISWYPAVESSAAVPFASPAPPAS